MNPSLTPSKKISFVFINDLEFGDFLPWILSYGLCYGKSRLKDIRRSFVSVLPTPSQQLFFVPQQPLAASGEQPGFTSSGFSASFNDSVMRSC